MTTDAGYAHELRGLTAALQVVIDEARMAGLVVSLAWVEAESQQGLPAAPRLTVTVARPL